MNAAKEKLEIVIGAASPQILNFFAGGIFRKNAFGLIQEYCTKKEKIFNHKVEGNNNFRKTMEKFPEEVEQEEVQEISPADGLRNFYEENTWAKYESVMRGIDILEKNDPEFLKKTWKSTEDLREVGKKLEDRAIARIKSFGIELVADPSAHDTSHLSTPEGVKGGKLDAPNFLTDPIGYEKYMKAQKDKTPFSGLTPEQSAALLESFNEFSEAEGYTHMAHRYQFQLLTSRGGIEEIKEQGNMDVFLKLQEKMQFPFDMLMAWLNGKMAKLRHDPGFAYDKVKAGIEGLFGESESE